MLAENTLSDKIEKYVKIFYQNNFNIFYHYEYFKELILISYVYL